MEIHLRATAHLAESIPDGGSLEIPGPSTVGDVLDHLGIDGDLVMLIVVDGELGDVDTPVADGVSLELIPPISGG
jgi:sulfur carrier protein ThiS